jgi:MFS family permease
MAQRQTMRGLDWLFFFVADLQTGFGAFIAVYLTDHHWTQAQLGLALGVGSAATVLAQVPAGVVVDALRNKAVAAAAALAGIATGGVLMAMSPTLWPVLLAQAIYGFAACMLNPALAALTLGLVRAAAVAERLGRNARYQAIGSATGAALLGACGTYLSTRAVFWLAALLCIPALFALRTVAGHVAPSDAPTTVVTPHESVRHVLLDRRLIAWLVCAMLFHLSNAAMLPMAGVEITKRADNQASMIIAACILVPQLIVALLSPYAGRFADRWGRRWVLLVGFCALPVRAVLLAWVDDPLWIIPVQALDGLGGAAFGVMTPLIAADISGTGGRFNLRMGIIGLVVGGAASVSYTVAGRIATDMGTPTAFYALALVGICAVLAVALGMPETRPARGGSDQRRTLPA